MNGMEAVQHGVSMLLRNLGPALRVSIGPVVIGIAVSALLSALLLGNVWALLPGAGQEMTPEDAAALAASLGWGAALGGLLSAVVWLFALSWVAVAWHRYVLLEERSGLLPPLRQDLVWPYLGRTILLAIVVFLLGIPLGLVLGLVFGASQSWTLLFIAGVITRLVLGWVAMRLSLVLPARAVDNPMTFGESWSSTAPASGGILVVVLVLGIINVLLGMILPMIFGSGLIGAILNLVIQWFTAMLGLSVLTTLYGNLVERRALAA